MNLLYRFVRESADFAKDVCTLSRVLISQKKHMKTSSSIHLIRNMHVFYSFNLQRLQLQVRFGFKSFKIIKTDLEKRNRMFEA